MLIRIAVAAVAGCLSLMVAACTSGSATDGDGGLTREQRVAEYFAMAAPDIAAKEGLPSPPRLAYVMVDEDHTATDGRVRSLWVSTAGQTRGRCHYLYTELAGRFVQDTGGCGGGEGRTVTLSGAANDKEADLVGDVGTWPAASVSITAGGLGATVPVKNGFFLVPVRVTTAGARTYDISLRDADAKEIGQATGVKAPGR